MYLARVWRPVRTLGRQNIHKPLDLRQESVEALPGEQLEDLVQGNHRRGEPEDGGPRLGVQGDDREQQRRPGDVEDEGVQRHGQRDRACASASSRYLNTRTSTD